MSTESQRNRVRVVEHYTKYSERDRLGYALGELEYARTCEVLERVLPRAGLVLDIGGGPGAYSRWLLGRGHSVLLLDPVPKHVEQAQAAFEELGAEERATAIEGTALDLPFEDASADAALLMGPLYHLTERADRLRALGECLRVTKPGAVLVAACISRFASLLDGLDRRFLWDPVFERIVRQDLATGQHRNPTGNLEYFTDGFFHRPDELAAEVREAGFTDVTVLGVEGPLWADRELAADWKDASRRALLLELSRAVEAEPTLVGASPHLLAVARGGPPRSHGQAL